ncbi:glucosamine-6-phosphate deaminase [Paenibacillus mucilaginosus]|uniref:Glucosamine-6-phosphate deaminase n=3 Tax=Paenibacillus mucilaginosus TaxID=61624 RepID=H6NEN9_9BACL|nr:glucosamine-6-phosphate deaminase [Paenibacillus mucilaginosus]AEI39661.1 glucosamine-6-phosphate isomerase [Paenibacillus mucilaginosus KNP414]AFC28343.1 glucosamine-6-phosphate isomerase [Paenibacillus mucilaginosus 3016]AFH60520.1 glucosamine-6-phosphate deaminase [Paenibacillus mucilaginosus K02]MCG7217753.1 glucosamine-6-phosphate deaminase [Paenibacillus mucilaginosus]WDM28970.1 glucosamine-6-phosphate deaminase [Paenibacillus mucilaginosus]
MNILTFRSQDELNKAGAGIITGLLQTNPKACLGLATGGTPVGIYRELVETCRQGLVSFSKASAFNLDEYVGLDRSHPASYYTFMQEHLFSHVDIAPERCHIPDGSAPDPEAECVRYDSLLEEIGQIDLQLLGLGHNGHIGFNEPDEELERGTHVVELQEQTRQANARFFDRPDQVPTHAITMGVGTILKAKTILLIVRGRDKAEIVKRALQGPITTECPASLLQTHPHVVVLLDSEAGSLLS